MKISRRGFLSVLTGSTAALVAGVTIPVAAAAPVAPVNSFAGMGTMTAGMGDWMELHNGLKDSVAAQVKFDKAMSLSQEEWTGVLS